MNSIKVIPADFSQASGDLSTIRQSLEGYRADLERVYSSFSYDSKGKTARAFTEHYQKLLASYQGLTEKIDELQFDIATAGQTLGALDQKLASVLNKSMG